MLSEYKSPYGVADAILRIDDGHWLRVKSIAGFRYFKASNWTHFEKDMALEITEAEFNDVTEDLKRAIANGGRFQF